MPKNVAFAFVALDGAGRRVSGHVRAPNVEAAFAELQGKGVSPLRIDDAGRSAANPFRRGLSNRDLSEFTADLAALLAAGADMRVALDMLGRRAERGSLKRLASELAEDISGGSSVAAALGRHLAPRQQFVGSLVGAGEAGVGMAAGLARASEMLQGRVKLRDQLLTTLSYPAFILATTILAIGVILLFVIPALAPLVADAGGQAPVPLAIAIAVSGFLRSNLALLGISVALALAAGMAIWRAGLAGQTIGRFLLDGPGRRTVGGLTFGPFAVTLGSLLVGGAAMSEALRLATDGVSSSIARARLQDAAAAVRQGEPLSEALSRVAGLPSALVRLSAVGEASGSLGEMLRRAGTIEEEKAMRRLDAVGKALGPALVVVLGAFVGLLMSGLLSGVSQLGAMATQ